MNEGGQISVTLKNLEGQTVEAVVEDTGPGFPDELLENGPKAFFTTKAPGQGTGLGLIVCQQIAEKHGARFLLEKGKNNRGAVVRMKFPAVAQPVTPGSK